MSVAFVQSVSALAAPSADLSIPFPNPVADHETIILVVVNYSTSITSVDDNYGNTYLPIANDPSNNGLSLFYAKNVNGSGGVSNFTPTVHFLAPEFAWAAAHDVSGCDRTAPLDQFTITTGTGGTPATGAVTTTSNGQYIFAAFGGGSSSSFVSAGAGFTARESYVGGLFLTEDRVQSAAGSIAATFGPDNINGAWITGIATFKAAASAASTNAIFLGCNT